MASICRNGYTDHCPPKMRLALLGAPRVRTPALLRCGPDASEAPGNMPRVVATLTLSCGSLECGSLLPLSLEPAC